MAEEEGQNPEANESSESKASIPSEDALERLKEFNALLNELNSGALSDLVVALNKVSQAAKDSAGATDNARDSVNKWAASGEGAFQELAKRMGVVKDADTTFVGFAANVMNGAVSLKSLKAGLKGAFGPLEVAISIINKFAVAMHDLAMETDNLIAELNRSTGAGTRFATEIAGMSATMSAANVSVGELTETYADLSRNFLGFNKINDQQRRGIVETTAVLSELGVAGEITADNFNTLMTGFQMTQEEASRFQREMFVIARESLIPPEVMSEGFRQALPQLGAFGKKATDVYLKLAVNAKAAGMATQDVLSITEKFDRFDTAAESVGKLNAILGGPYLSTTRMIRQTDPTERIRMLSDAAREAGKSFDTMEYFETKALAAAMGLQDVNQLALVMNGQFDLLGPNIERSAAEITELAKTTNEFNSIMEVLKNTFMSLVANLSPLVMGIKDFVGGFQDLLFKYPAIKITLAGIALAIAAIVASMAGGPIGVTIGIIVAGVIVAFSILYTFFSDLDNIMKEATASTFAFGAVIALAFWPLVLTFGAVYVAIKRQIEIIRFLYNALEPVIDAIGEFISFMDSALEPAMDRMREQFSTLSAEFEKLYEAFELLAGDLMRDLMPALKVVGFVIGAAVTGAIFILIEMITFLTSAITFVVRALTLFAQIIRPLAAAIRALYSPFVRVNAFMTGFNDSIGKGAGFVESLGAGLKNLLTIMENAAGISFDNEGFLSNLSELFSDLEPYASALMNVANAGNLVQNAMQSIADALGAVHGGIERIIGIVPKMIAAISQVREFAAEIDPTAALNINTTAVRNTAATTGAAIAQATGESFVAIRDRDLQGLTEAVMKGVMNSNQETKVVIEAADGLFKVVDTKITQNNQNQAKIAMGKLPN